MTDEKIPYHKVMALPPGEQMEVHARIDELFEKGQITNGIHCRRLEQWFMDYYHVKYAIATCNCTQGLIIALSAVYQQYRPTAQVHTPAFAWYSTQRALESQGFVPVWEDIDPETWIMEGRDNFDCALPVHTFGNTAQCHARRIIYDGAHTVGARLPDVGDATVFSLAPTKIITSIEGGMVITDNDLLAANITALRDKTCRLSEIHAIFGNAYLKHLKEVMLWKLKCNTLYRAAKIGIMQVCACDYNMNTIGVLNAKLKIPPSIETRKYYEPLIHGLKNTDLVYNRITCLPSWYNCPVDEVIKRIKEANE
jgi:dTDP-4-amino-4,6-dideoxygalactose transaminase